MSRVFVRTSGASLMLWALSAWASPAVIAQPEIAAAPVLEDRYPRSSVEFPGGVESLPDLVYSTLPGYRPLRLDLYRQKLVTQTGRPLVVYVHGGGWLSGHTRHAGAFANWPAVLASLAAKGYVVASIEYRLSSEAPFPAALDDVKTSVRWLRSRAREFGIDPAKVVLWGGSAGGQLAALAATSCGEDNLAPPLQSAESLRGISDCVQGLVAWYGVFDFSTITLRLNAGSAADPVVNYLGCAPAACAGKAGLASAVTHLDAKDPPTLLVHGENDRVVPVGQSRAFMSALQAKRIPAELLVIPDVDHSFIGASAVDTREASLRALSATFAFIDATVGGH